MKPAKRKADPKAQKLYDLVMLQARAMIFGDEQKTKMIVDSMKGTGGSPIEGIAYTAAMILRSVDGGFKKKGQPVPPAILMAVFVETVGDLTEVAAADGLIKPEDKPAVAKDAIHMGAKIFKSPPKQQGQQGPQPQAPQPAPEQGLVEGARA